MDIDKIKEQVCARDKVVSAARDVIDALEAENNARKEVITELVEDNRDLRKRYNESVKCAESLGKDVQVLNGEISNRDSIILGLHNDLAQRSKCVTDDEYDDLLADYNAEIQRRESIESNFKTYAKDSKEYTEQLERENRNLHERLKEAGKYVPLDPMFREPTIGKIDDVFIIPDNKSELINQLGGTIRQLHRLRRDCQILKENCRETQEILQKTQKANREQGKTISEYQNSMISSAEKLRKLEAEYKNDREIAESSKEGFDKISQALKTLPREVPGWTTVDKVINLITSYGFLTSGPCLATTACWHSR